MVEDPVASLNLQINRRRHVSIIISSENLNISLLVIDQPESKFVGPVFSLFCIHFHWRLMTRFTPQL